MTRPGSISCLLPILFALALPLAAKSQEKSPLAIRTRISEEAGATHWRIVFQDADGRRATIDLTAFNQRSHRFLIIDNPDKNGPSLDSAAHSSGAVAAVNGGYFHPDRTPVGLLIAGGKLVHGYEKARLLSGLLFQNGRGNSSILRSRTAPTAQRIPWTDALQCGPMLVENGKQVPGLEPTRLARRTFVAESADGWRAIGTISPVSLAQAADLLRGCEIAPGKPIIAAMNLDGGSSSGFWFRNGERPFYLAELAKVRNYVAVVPSRR